MKLPKAVDLFSGCGGLTQGLTDAGFSVVGAVELDAVAADTYRMNHPNTQLFQSDIRKLSATRMRETLSVSVGELALLAACAPCQGFSRLSTLNRPQAHEDPRNDLVLTITPFVKAFLPKGILLENVPGAKDSEQMSFVRRKLTRFGYKLREDVIDVADFGVPQRRRRYVVVGSLDSVPELPQQVPQRATVRTAIGFLPAPGSTGDVLHDLMARTSNRIQRLISSIPKDGGSRNALSSRQQLACHKDFRGFSDVYGRMRWDSPSPTITGGFINPSKGRFLHPEQDRAISLREGAILQGFPRDYQFPLVRGKYAVATMIGNAVPPQFARVQAELMLKKQ